MNEVKAIQGSIFKMMEGSNMKKGEDESRNRLMFNSVDFSAQKLDETTGMLNNSSSAGKDFR